jgi:N4-(beta-N-acetylglucosaminyl)-L-asparaginase
MDRSRRNFLVKSCLTTASFSLASRVDAQVQDSNHAQHNHLKPERPAVPGLPALICKVTSTLAIDQAYQMLLDGSDTLDAALHVCKTQEDNPGDHSAGLGGLPNEREEVQLDACCWHGPTRRVAAVGSVSGIRNASLLAHSLMSQTGNALMVGCDAQAFALTQGFQKEELLTERTRQTYQVWKKISSSSNLLGAGTYDSSWPEASRNTDFLPNSQKEFDTLLHKLEPIALEAGVSSELTWRAVFDAVAPAAEPVYVAAIDRKGQLSSACTSSGQPWRIPGTSSDVAVLGSGSFLDPDVGSAGSSGNAEANIRIAGAHSIVDNMRKGMSPADSGMDALRRIANCYDNDVSRLRFIEMVYYILRKDGAYASVSLWNGDKTGHVRQFTIADAANMRRTEDCLSLFQCSPLNSCPVGQARPMI